MEKYIVRVQVIGESFEFSVSSQTLAEKAVKDIKANGYTVRDGNAYRHIPKVVSVEWRKERGNS